MSATLRSCFALRPNLKSIFVRTSDRYAPLDGIRAFSILLVIVYHALYGVSLMYQPEEFVQILSDMPWYWRWMAYAEKGVDSFFVLSGFLIGTMLMKEFEEQGRIDLKRFYWRRALRLFPAAWFLVLMAAIFAKPDGPDRIYLLSNFFYVNNFIDPENQHIVWTWSLAVEEQFYLIFPLFLMFCFYPVKHRMALLLGMIGISCAIRWLLLVANPQFYQQPFAWGPFDNVPQYIPAYSGVVYDNLYTRFGALVIGVLSAYLHRHHREKLQYLFQEHAWAGTLLLVLSLVVTVMVLAVPLDGSASEFNIFPSMNLWFHVLHRNVFCAGIAVIILATLYPKGVARALHWFLSWKIWFPVAQLSYTLYLFHGSPLALVIFSQKRHILTEAGPDMWWILLLSVVGTVVAGLFCIVIYLIFEKPFMNMRDLGKKSKAHEHPVVVGSTVN